MSKSILLQIFWDIPLTICFTNSSGKINLNYNQGMREWVALIRIWIPLGSQINTPNDKKCVQSIQHLIG